MTKKGLASARSGPNPKSDGVRALIQAFLRRCFNPGDPLFHLSRRKSPFGLVSLLPSFHSSHVLHEGPRVSREAQLRRSRSPSVLLSRSRRPSRSRHLSDQISCDLCPLFDPVLSGEASGPDLRFKPVGKISEEASKPAGGESFGEASGRLRPYPTSGLWTPGRRPPARRRRGSGATRRPLKHRQADRF